MPDETVYARLDAQEGRVARLEGMTDVVTAVRADMATVAAAIDPISPSMSPSSKPAPNGTPCC
jgi:hypothetical protein